MAVQEELDKAMDELQVDGEASSMVKELIGPIVGSAMMIAAVAAATAIIGKLIATNYKNNNVTGDKEYRPTENEANISKVEVAGKDTDAALAADEVTGNDGNLALNQLEGHAATSEATAADVGASALKTKAGALDVKTKGMTIA